MAVDIYVANDYIWFQSGHVEQVERGKCFYTQA